MYSEARNAVQVIYTLGRWLNSENRRGQPVIKRFLGGREKGRRTANHTKNKGRTPDRRLRRGSKRFLASLTAKVDANKLPALNACYGNSGKRLPAQTST